MENNILIFTGVSASGKSTLVNKLSKDYNLKILDVLEYVKPYLEKYGSEKVQYQFLKPAYRDMIKDLPNAEFDILEVANDFPEEFLPEIIKNLKKCPTLIFCEASLETCIKRNRQRERLVPEETVIRQFEYNLDFFKELAKDLQIEFISISTEGALNIYYEDMVTRLGLM